MEFNLGLNEIYEYNFFLSIKDEVLINTKLKEQINSLFDDNYRENYTKKVTTYYSNYNINNLHNKVEKKIIRKIKNKKLELFALLNKLTDVNYNSILNEISKLIYQDKNLFLDSINDFWIFSYKQSVYSILYINILKTLLILSKDDELNKMIIDKLSEIINNFLNIELIEICNKENNTNYDEFCDNNTKHKYIRGKIITICWIILKTDFNIITKDKLIKEILKYELSIDLTIDMLHIFNTLVGLDNKLIIYLKEYIKNCNIGKDTEKSKVISNKIKYKILDIIENRIFHLDSFKILPKVKEIPVLSSGSDEKLQDSVNTQSKLLKTPVTQKSIICNDISKKCVSKGNEIQNNTPDTGNNARIWNTNPHHFQNNRHNLTVPYNIVESSKTFVHSRQSFGKVPSRTIDGKVPCRSVNDKVRNDNISKGKYVSKISADEEYLKQSNRWKKV
jgi:hypothetical protein